MTANEHLNPNNLAVDILPFNGDIQIRDVMQDKVDERLILVFANVFNKRLRRELLSQLVGGQPVLSKPVIKFVDNCKEEENSEARGLGLDVKANLGCRRRPIVQRSL